MPRANHMETSPADAPNPDALKAFLNLADLWRLNTDQQVALLGRPARSTYFKWKKEGALMRADTDERISNLLAIFKALQILFPDPARADEWIRRPNRFFEDRSALEVMLGGKLENIFAVRAYLDAQRGG